MTETALALATRITEPFPGTDFNSRADGIVSVAARSRTPVEMIETLGWSETDLPVAERIFTMVDRRFSGISSELLDDGVLDTSILERTPITARVARAS